MENPMKIWKIYGKSMKIWKIYGKSMKIWKMYEYFSSSIQQGALGCYSTLILTSNDLEEHKQRNINHFSQYFPRKFS